MKLTMWKTILAGTTALAIAGTTLAYAQQGPAGRDHGPNWQPTAQDRAAFGDARIAAIHAGLKLTPEQEKNWPAVEAALRDLSKQRSERFVARASADKPADPVARLSQRADALAQQGAALKKVADATGPLYKSLDDGQKHRLVVLARNVWQQEGGWRGHHGGKHHRHGPRGHEHGRVGSDGGKQPQ